MSRVEIVATGSEFIKEGIRGFESVLEELITGAEKEIHLVAYLITSSALPVLHMLEKASERGVRVVLMVNSVYELEEKVKSYLFRLHERSGTLFQIVSFRDFMNRELHAKIIVVDRRKALVGSANLSWGGIAGNYEMGILVEGEPAWQIAKVIETVSRQVTQSQDK